MRFNSYLSPTKTSSGDARHFTNSDLDGEFFYRRKIFDRKEGQLGVGFYRRLYNLKDPANISSNEVDILGKEDYINISIALSNRYSIAQNIEINLGSGVYYSILESLSYFSTTGAAMSATFQDQGAGFYKKIGVLSDASICFKFPNRKLNIHTIIGQRMTFDLLVTKGAMRYLSYGGYIGAVYEF